MCQIKRVEGARERDPNTFDTAGVQCVDCASLSTYWKLLSKNQDGKKYLFKYIQHTGIVFVFASFNHTIFSPGQPARGLPSSALLDKSWSQVSSPLSPRYMPPLLQRIGFSIPTCQLFMLVDFRRKLACPGKSSFCLIHVQN